MPQLNEKYYNILNQLHNGSLLSKDLPHDDFVVLFECGYLRNNLPNTISSKGLLALDEYRSQSKEKNKSSMILVVTIISTIIGILSLMISIIAIISK